MRRHISRLATLVISAFLFSCGVSEQRVGALESQLNKMKEASAEGDTGPQVVALQEKVTTHQTSSDERAKKMEEMLEVLQREVSRVANAPKSEAPAASGSPWADVDAVLGLAGDGISETGDGQYSVNRGWAERNVRAMALAGEGPKLSEGKAGGVALKGVKPKSFVGQLGLKNNDVVIAINDKPIATVVDISAALRASASPAVVKIKRKKKELTLQYTLVD